MAVVWGTPEYHVPRLSGSQRMAVTRGSILFDDARAQMLASDPLRSDLWVGSVVLPVTADEPGEAIFQLRGWIRTAPPARATLFATIGPWRVAIAFDDARDEPLLREAAFPIEAGEHRIAVTMLLQVEGPATLAVDSVDVAIRTSAASGRSASA